MFRNNELNNFSVAELLRLHVGISEQLRTREIVRGENLPTGDLAEFLFCRSYEWQQANNSEKAFDAKDREGKRYQIKGRRMHQRTNSRQLSAIRDLEGFDILAAVLFGHEYQVLRAALIPNEVVRSRSKHVKHDNKWNFILTDDVWDEESVSDVTGDLNITWNQLCCMEPTEDSLSNRTVVGMRKMEKSTKVKAMDKRSSMERVNALGHELLNHYNAHFSNVNKTIPIWWFNIPLWKFENDLHLLCAKNMELIWLKIDANTFRYPKRTFRFRSDKEVVDLEISCDRKRYYMHDVKSGGSRYDFRPHIQRKWP